MTQPSTWVATRLAAKVPSLLQEKSFRRFWSAQSISYLGDQVTSIALPLVAVLSLHASAAQMGLLGAMTSLPNMLFSLHAGALVDRYGRRRVAMIVCDVLRGLLLASVPVGYAFDSLSLIHLYVVSFIAGVLAVVFNVSSYSLLAALVPRPQMVQAMSLTRGSFSFSWVSGPALGGALVQALSAPVVLVLDSVSFFASALMLRSIAIDDPAGDPRIRPDITSGLRFVRQNAVLAAKFAGGIGLNFFYSIYFTLLVLFASRELHLSAGMIGAVLSVGAIGALIGTTITSSLGRRFGLGWTFIIGSIGFPGALVLTPLATDDRWVAFTFLVIAEFVSGVALMLCDIGGSSIQQGITPDQFRSRVQGAHLAVINGMRTAGALVAGAIGTWVGLRPALWLAVIGGVLSALPLLLSPIRRIHDLPDTDDADVDVAGETQNVEAAAKPDE